MIFAFWGIFVLSAGFSIYCRYNNRLWYNFAKPVPLFLLIGMYAMNPSSLALYQLFLAGIVAGVVGDILLLREQTFRYGAAFFFLGHVLYIVAFYRMGGWPALGVLLLILGYSVIYCVFLFRRLQTQGGVGNVWMGTPYLLMVSILLMFASSTVGQMGNRYTDVVSGGIPGIFQQMVLFGGALLFYISDLVLVWNRYAGKFQAGQIVVLGTYYSAQALITWGALKYIS
ncbi:MAG: lysoplasmalogenase [Spirochaetia bacterium]|nr:lysoplasmalogenase [Spirochaetia bacterium]